MAGAQPGTIVAMKILVEQDAVPPLRVFLEFCRPSVNGTPPALITKKNTLQAQRNVFRNLEQRHVFSRTRRAFHFELVTIKGIHVQQPTYDQNIDWHPNRS